MNKYKLDSSYLRPHQSAILEAIEKFNYFPNGKQTAALVYSSTSSGKTVEELFHACKKANSGKKVLIVAPSKATLERIQDEYISLKDKDVIVGGLPKLCVLSGESIKADFSFALKLQDIIVISLQYLIQRVKDKEFSDFFKKIDVLILEEGHHVAADEWSKIVKPFPAAEVTYYTGTPVRHDKTKMPLVPYSRKEKEGSDKGWVEYTVLDLASITGIAEARFTRKDADNHKLIKKTCALITNQQGIVISIEGIDRTFDSLAEAKRVSQNEGLNVSIYRDPGIIARSLTCYLERYKSTVKNFSKIPKLSVLVKAYETDDCDKICEIANKVGWNALPYYASIEDSKIKTLKQNRKNFEDVNHKCNMLVQCRTLSEGYNNPYVFMTILMINLESYPELEQYGGRGIRLIPGIEHQPPHILTGLEFGAIPQLLMKYEKLETDMSFCVWEGEKNNSLGKDYVTRPTTEISSPGDTVITYDGQQGQQGTPEDYAKYLPDHMKDGYYNMIRGLQGNTAIMEVPSTFTTQDAITKREYWKNKVFSEIYKHKFYGVTLHDIVQVKTERQKLVSQCFSEVFNYFNPKVKKWTGNANLDPEKAWAALKDIEINFEKYVDKTILKIKQRLVEKVDIEDISNGDI
jgi:superfamily II DNA or RNA helicase